MSKLFVRITIVFLMVFVTGLAYASPPVEQCTSGTPCTGYVWLVADDAAGAVTQITGVELVLSKAPVPNPNTSNQPNNIWTGTITLPAITATNLTISSPITVYVSALQGPEDTFIFHISGTDGGTLLLKATGQENYRVPNSPLSCHHGQSKPAFGISGVIYDSAVAGLTGSFEGVISY
ncbi:MAG TPA: hypothetical protein VEF34_19820 [Syntrophobacteraceae bacterium]|nr:hypothetical protein [Syntrophobacteraceae bacterium]